MKKLKITAVDRTDDSLEGCLDCLLQALTQNSKLIFLGGGGGGGALVAQTVESACSAGDLGLMPGLGRSPGDGNGNPLQYSCLENPMDGGAWQATVHGVAKNRTRLSNFTLLYTLVSFFYVYSNAKQKKNQVSKLSKIYI